MLLAEREEASCTVLIRQRPALALAAAAFAAELGRTDLVACGRSDYSDVHPEQWLGCRTVIWVDFARDVLLGTCPPAALELADLIQALGHELVMIPELKANGPAAEEDERFFQSFRTMLSGYFPDRSGASASLAHAADTLAYPKHAKPSALVDLLASSAYASLGHLYIPRVQSNTTLFTAEVRRLAKLARRFAG